MTIKIGINGYGRIGRNILRALYESGRTDEFQIVAINDLGNTETNAHLTRYDTAHGKFPGTVSVDGDYMVINGDKIRVLSERDPAKLPWEGYGQPHPEPVRIQDPKWRASRHRLNRQSFFPFQAGFECPQFLTWKSAHGMFQSSLGGCREPLKAFSFDAYPRKQ